MPHIAACRNQKQIEPRMTRISADFPVDVVRISSARIRVIRGSLSDFDVGNPANIGGRHSEVLARSPLGLPGRPTLLTRVDIISTRAEIASRASGAVRLLWRKFRSRTVYGANHRDTESTERRHRRVGSVCRTEPRRAGDGANCLVRQTQRKKRTGSSTDYADSRRLKFRPNQKICANLGNLWTAISVFYLSGNLFEPRLCGIRLGRCDETRAARK